MSPPKHEPTAGSPELTVVFPAYQEEEYLEAAVRAVVEGLRSRSPNPFEVIVVENGSRDRTFEVAEKLAETYPEVSARRMDSADYGRALRAGLVAATGDFVVNFDVDLFDLDFLDRAVTRIRAPGGPAIVVATKRGAGAIDNRRWTRRLVTGVFSSVLRYGFGLKVSDTHGMKAMRRAAVVPYAEKCLFGTDLFDTELILRCERAGLATGELPVTIDETRPARTPILPRIVRTFRGLAKLRLALWRERS